ncbi:EAL domain-containing protein, partial [Frankia sp. EI5c]|uniref:EAL domain-containing protein n=1 Tax=Frankia sp. EI5c TaxID=683316 RepID=UPI001F5BC034
LGTGQIEVHYQEKVDLGSGRPHGVEALVRWRHPSRGLLTPEAFVPLAEQAGLMRTLTVEVLELALAQCQRWRDAAVDVTVAVNLAASDLLDRAFPDQVRRLLRQYSLPPAALELEITETTLMRDLVRSAAVLDELRALGVQIAVDDYGTGYSSLAYLQELPVDILKMDKSFVTRLEDGSRARRQKAEAIVRSTIGLAHELGLRIVVEGVDSASALTKLRNYGCDLAQGYFLGRPRPAAELTAVLSSPVSCVEWAETEPASGPLAKPGSAEDPSLDRLKRDELSTDELSTGGLGTGGLGTGALKTDTLETDALKTGGLPAGGRRAGERRTPAPAGQLRC